MATPASFEASEIRRRGRQRLIGAVAIVVLLVVFVPMILDSEPRQARNQPELAIPSKDNAPPLPAPTPPKASESHAAATPAPSEAAPAAKPQPSAPAPATSSSTATTAPAPAATTPPASATKATAAEPKPAEPPPVARVTPKASSPSAAAAPKLEGFAVQVGAFREESKLKHARDKLTAAGIPHYTERLEGASSGLTRLRAGPFKTREAAEAALAKVKRASLGGRVVPLP